MCVFVINIHIYSFVLVHDELDREGEPRPGQGPPLPAHYQVRGGEDPPPARARPGLHELDQPEMQPPQLQVLGAGRADDLAW